MNQLAGSSSGPIREPEGPAGTHRYEVLDALRGICAICVCLFHFKAAGPIMGLSFVRGSWLFVDFFFVLSGFVIAVNYRARLIGGGFIGRFAVLRLGRVWPLHIVVLLALIGFELIGLVISQPDLMQRRPFTGTTSPEAIVTNILLIQSFGLHDSLTWNQPAWSIAAEFWTYLLFAVAAWVFGSRLDQGLFVVAILASAFLFFATPYGINVTYDWSLVRCIYGFALGALAWSVWSNFHMARLAALGRWPRGRATLVEAGSILLVIAFVSYCETAPSNLAAPLLFSAVLLVFAAEAGAISSFLRHRIFALLGRLSYSIYMVHALVQARFDDGLSILEKLFGMRLLSKLELPGGTFTELVGSTPAQGVMFTILMLLIVIGVSWVTSHLVEKPGQRFARKLANRMAFSDRC